MDDLVARYSKSPAGKSAQTTPPKGSDEYVAFETKDKLLCLTILRATDPARSPIYALKMDVAYDDSHYTNFVICYTYMLVLVRGRNLKPIVDALKMNTADFIQEFDAKRWAKPKDDTAPFISSIEVVMQQSGPSMAESEGPGRNLH
jgi:hypothetical protein